MCKCKLGCKKYITDGENYNIQCMLLLPTSGGVSKCFLWKFTINLDSGKYFHSYHLQCWSDIKIQKSEVTTTINCRNISPIIHHIKYFETNTRTCNILGSPKEIIYEKIRICLQFFAKACTYLHEPILVRLKLRVNAWETGKESW